MNAAPLMAAEAVNPPTSPEHHRFHFLDALRGIAAILVIMLHAPRDFAHALLAHNAYMAVDFFFCLSGFVIAFSYEKRLRTFMSFANFTAVRLIRLWPAAFLGASLGAIELVVSHYVRAYPSAHDPLGTILTEIVLGFLILPHFSFANPTHGLFPVDGVMWTLFVEILANLCYAALLRLRMAINWVIVSITSISIILLAIEDHIHGHFDLGYRTSTAYGAFTRVGLSFFLGVLVYRLHQRRAPGSLYKASAFLLAAFIVVVFIACLCDPIQQTYTTPIDLSIVCIIFPLIVYAGSMVVLPKRWTAVCAFLGTISYPLYILHPPLLWFLSRSNYVRFAYDHPSRATLIMLVYALFLILIAWLSATFYDTPVRKVLTRKYRAYLQSALISQKA